MPYVNVTTPRKISGSVKRFLLSAGLSTEVVYLPFTFVADEYHTQYCLDNCEEERERTGCQIKYGWIIWEDRRKRFIEAEFHAIVVKAGVLCDITPRQDGENRVLFVEDPNRVPYRIDEITWSTYTNIKASNGIICNSNPIEIRNSGQTMQEKISDANSAQ